MIESMALCYHRKSSSCWSDPLRKEIKTKPLEKRKVKDKSNLQLETCMAVCAVLGDIKVGVASKLPSDVTVGSFSPCPPP